jgi:GTP-binding protein Era
MSPELPESDFRSGYVAVIGRPNVGKSSLVNALIGERLAPISPVPQTTRRRLLGILSQPEAQVVFVDTPGLHDAGLRLSQMMLADTDRALEDADLTLCVVDATREPGAEDRLAYARAQSSKVATILVINKIDLVADGGFLEAHRLDSPFETVLETSAVTGAGLDELLAAVIAGLPVAAPFFPEDQVSDAMEREIAADLIREAALGKLSEELPHAVAVKVEEWTERPGGKLYIHADLYVERDSQKGIVIGRGGRNLRSIGSQARFSLETWLQRPIYLDLQVKVLKGWRKDDRMLRFLGFDRR